MDKNSKQAEAPTLRERAQQMLEDETLLLGMFEEGEVPKWFDYLKDKVPSEAIVATLLDKALNDKDVRAIETLNKIQEDKSNSIELPDGFFDANKDIKIEIVTPTQKEEAEKEAELGE